MAEMRGFDDPSRGVWCADASPYAVARLARSGFDWLCLDAQHGLYRRSELIAAAREFPIGAADLVVRVAAADFVAIGWALDAGAGAIIVPQVGSVADAESAVRACRYPAGGERSWGQFGVPGG